MKQDARPPIAQRMRRLAFVGLDFIDAFLTFIICEKDPSPKWCCPEDLFSISFDTASFLRGYLRLQHCDSKANRRQNSAPFAGGNPPAKARMIFSGLFFQRLRTKQMQAQPATALGSR